MRPALTNSIESSATNCFWFEADDIGDERTFMAEERTEKSRALDLAVSQIEKQFGKGSIMRLGGIDSTAALDAISSGSLSLDLALGVGGYPRGRVIEVFGPESSGKTTLTLHAIAEAQRHRFEIQNVPDLHQPDTREDRRHVWQSRNHHRRARPEALRFRPRGCAAHRFHQRWRCRHRKPDQGKNRQEQGCSAVP